MAEPKTYKTILKRRGVAERKIGAGRTEDQSGRGIMDDLEVVYKNGDRYIVPRTMSCAFATHMSVKDDQKFPRATDPQQASHLTRRPPSRIGGRRSPSRTVADAISNSAMAAFSSASTGVVVTNLSLRLQQGELPTTRSVGPCPPTRLSHALVRLLSSTIQTFSSAATSHRPRAPPC